MRRQCDACDVLFLSRYTFQRTTTACFRMATVLSTCGLCQRGEDPYRDEEEINNFEKMRGYLLENGRMQKRSGPTPQPSRSKSLPLRSSKRASDVADYDVAPQKVVPRDNWERANVRYGLAPRKFIFSNQSGITVFMIVTAREVEETSIAIRKLSALIGANTSSEALPDVARYRAAARAQKMFVNKGTQQEVLVEESYAYISVLSRDRLMNWVEHVRNYYVDVGYTKSYQLLPADVTEGKVLTKLDEQAYGMFLQNY